MLFYHHATTALPLPPARSWGGAWRPKSRRISNKSSWAQGLCEIVAHCRPKSPKVAQKAAQGTKMVLQSSLWGLQGSPFLENSR